MSELAADGIPVAVTCRVLDLARQPYYRWLSQPVTGTEYRQAHVANAVFDAHRNDPEFLKQSCPHRRTSGVRNCHQTLQQALVPGEVSAKSKHLQDQAQHQELEDGIPDVPLPSHEFLDPAAPVVLAKGVPSS